MKCNNWYDSVLIECTLSNSNLNLLEQVVLKISCACTKIVTISNYFHRLLQSNVKYLRRILMNTFIPLIYLTKPRKLFQCPLSELILTFRFVSSSSDSNSI